MNSNFYKILQHSKENQSIIAIYNDPEGDNFWAGYILDFNDEFFTMQHISKYGKKDGILIEPYFRISRIDVDDYCKCLNYLKERHTDLDEENLVTFNVTSEENWINQILNELNNQTEYVSRIQFNNNSRFSGFIRNLTENDFELKCIGSEGTDEGFLYFQIDDISSIRVNDLEARRRLFLYNYRRSIDFFDE
ncbi:hypothetical protein ACTS9D_17125 [Empedobacter brevis]